MTTEPKNIKYRFQSEIQQMMFVFGEVAGPIPETTLLVEDIVRSQVIEIAAAQASRRNSRYLSAEDLIFLMRHDRARVNRLRSFLSWKDVRKNAKDASSDQVDEIVEEATSGKLYRSIIKLPWELVNQFIDALVKPSNPEEESDDEDDLEAYMDSVQRLKDADEITRAMTREEYVHYSECRQASFTYRKGKRFREWSNMSSFVDVRPNDDIVDSLGFLAYEMVSRLTRTAIQIKQDLSQKGVLKKEEDMVPGTKRKREVEEEGGEGGAEHKHEEGISTVQSHINGSHPQHHTTISAATANTAAATTTTAATTTAATTVTTATTTTATTATTTTATTTGSAGSVGSGSLGHEKDSLSSSSPASDHEGTGLFLQPSSEPTPLQPEHIHEAFRRMQQTIQPLRHFRGGLNRTRLLLI
ncbi:transcription initiation factor IID, 18kD subunit-domain-containing protein [Spinellus fusiger]|nr:transcription initiation factor IID, 18kD subunit-domain-containing protein [Spinellus fusiger]